MKNEYLTVEDYKKYINLFKFSENDLEIINSYIRKVRQIILLKRETCQTSRTTYLRPIMLPEDYKNIDKALKTQKEFKLERMSKKYRETLEKAGNYTQEEIDKMVEKYKKNNKRM